MRGNVVLGISGSPRSLIKSQEFLSLIDKCKDFDQLYEIIYKLGGDKKIGNSEALLLAALYGVREMGIGLDHLLLSYFFSKYKKTEDRRKALEEIVRRSNGIVIASPVYFGDRSSLIAEWFSQLKTNSDLTLDNKAAGIISVGAKRNGGQETTNIFALYDCMNLGACVVGNGPPTSQYGGTAIGGSMGAIIDDTFGLRTSRGTGQRVGLLSKILTLAPAECRFENKTRILFLVTRKDRHDKFLDKISALTFSENVETEILDITSKPISHCRACPVCPMGPLDKKYTCVIRSSKKDEMESIHNSLTKADAIVIAHYNGQDAGSDQYQIFMERTRFIRRNNFELANRIFSTFYETHHTADIFILRSLSSFLRHNMFLAGPFYSAYKNAENQISENIDLDLYSKRLEIAAKKAKLAKIKGYNSSETSYLPVGYPQKD